MRSLSSRPLRPNELVGVLVGATIAKNIKGSLDFAALTAPPVATPGRKPSMPRQKPPAHQL